jgi:Coenzyme PQQ synthesis protein D (PqqD)
VNTPSYRRRTDILWRRSLDKIVCLPPDESEPVTLAGTGPQLWDLLQTPHSLSELAAELAARHRVDPEVVAAGVAPVLARLAALGVVDAVL